MDVLRDNFIDILPVVTDAINESDFIAIDGEFTGIGKGLPSKVLFDTPAQRYSRLKTDLSGIIIIQYGICSFKWNEETKCYDAKPFNFYIFPRPYKGKEPFFSCQSSSLEFLAGQNFDFNKLIRNGLSYMPPSQEASQRGKIEQLYAKNDLQTAPETREDNKAGLKSPLFIPSTMKEFVDEICSKIETFIQSEELSLDLPKVSAFKRKLTYEVIEDRFASKFYVETVQLNKNDKQMRLRKVDEEERKKLLSSKNAEKMAEFETAVGFLTIAKLLSRSQKLIVGHNMLIDLMLTINQFFTPLPDSYDDFKEIVQTFFPKLIDTKLLATSEPLKKKVPTSALDPLFAFLKDNFKEPEIGFEDGFGEYSEGNDKFHEAGYDAYCTGFSFLKMASHLCKLQQPEDELREINLNAEILNPFINRVFVMRINDLTYLTMDAPDDIPERKHVFHLQFPNNWKYADVNELFSQFGNVYTAFLDDTTAYVSLDKPENADEVIRKLVVQKNSGPCRVITYKQSVGLDPLDKYDKAEFLAIQEADCNGEKDKRRTKRKFEDTLEEGEVVSSPEATAPVDEVTPSNNADACAEVPKKKKPSEAKEFYEPDDW
ncbi:poly(A)-specific ribonuclease PARN-like [Rhopilema esculentum]|uniref:poly(A)-specific ribonuclease PARN-like n=1 Tax=Rhopilema esculentum TaxID=499914 RepID=UPI0031D55D09